MSYTLEHNDSPLKYIFQWEKKHITQTSFARLNTIYSTQTDIQIQPDNNHTQIHIWHGTHVFEIHEINTNYSIHTPYISFIAHTPGIFVIHAPHDEFISVGSLSSVLDIELTDTEKNVLNQITLYPHMYFRWNPKRGALVRDGDITRVQQVFQLWYTGYNSLDPESILSSLLWEDNEGLAMISIVMKRIQNTYQEAAKKMRLQTDTFSFPWEDRLKKYMSLFINEEKKLIYYQHSIRSDILNLFTQPEKKNVLIWSIIDTLDKIGKIHHSHADEIKDMVAYYYYYALVINNDVDIKISFSELMHRLTSNGKAFIIPYSSSLFVENIFFNQYFGNGAHIFTKIPNFTQKYIHDTSKSASYDSRLPYTLYFLEQVITDKSSYKDIPLPLFIELLENYQSIAAKWYQNTNSKITLEALFINETLLEKISYILRKHGFQDERNQNGLLERWTENISPYHIADIQQIIWVFFNFFNEHKWLLSASQNKTQDIAAAYQSQQSILNEMLLALSDHESYITQYDITKQQLLQEYNIKNSQEEYNFSINNALRYLRQFTGLSGWAQNVSIRGYNFCQDPNQSSIDQDQDIQAYCYQINNITMGKKKISFLLFPHEKNKIAFIKIQEKENTKTLNGTYKLDNIKIEYDEKYAFADEEDKFKFDFYNFFLTTFSDNNIVEEVKVFIDNEPSLEEDKFARAFKNSKLFGPEWDFTQIADVVHIAYNNVILEKDLQNSSYRAKIIASDIKQLSQKTSTPQIRWELIANYHFIPNKSFQDIVIRLYTDAQKGAKIYLLSWNNIYLEGDINIDNLETVLAGLFNQLTRLREIHTTIIAKSGVSADNISYTYIASDDSVKINFPHQNISAQILLNKNGISLWYNKRRMLDSTQSIISLGNILQTKLP